MDTKTKQLLKKLWAGGEFAFFWVTPARKTYWIKTDAIPENLNTMPPPHNLYFGIHPTIAIPETNARGEPKEKMYVRSQTNYIAAINCLYSEWDTDGTTEGKAHALAAVRSLSPAPTVIIDSGGGYHCYWLLKRTIYLPSNEIRESVKKVQWRWAQHYGGDKGVKDLCRVLRVPGSYNHKEKYAPNYPRVAFVRWLDIEYEFGELLAKLPPEPQQQRRTIERQHDGGNFDRAASVAERMIAMANDGEKHHTLLRAARLLGGFVGSGKTTRAEAEAVLRRAIEGRPDVRSLQNAYKTILDGIEYGEGVPL
jgi:hypothetical protein